MSRPVNIRQVLEALEFARLERMRTGSPDFLRARVGEARVQALCAQLLRGGPSSKKPAAADQR